MALSIPHYPDGYSVPEPIINTWYVQGGVSCAYSNTKHTDPTQSFTIKRNMVTSNNSGGLYLIRVKTNTSPSYYTYKMAVINKWSGKDTSYVEDFKDGVSTKKEPPYYTTYEYTRTNYIGTTIFNIADYRGVPDYECIFNCSLPIFDASDTNGINAYEKTGDISNAVNKDDLVVKKVISTVYVDGKKKPNIKITHNIDGGEPPKTYTIKCEVKGLLSLDYDTLFEKTYNFTDSSYMTTWGSLETSYSHLILEMKFTMYYNEDTYNAVTATIKNDGYYFPTSSVNGKHHLYVKGGSGEDDDGYSDTINDSNAIDENINVNTCDLLTSTYKVSVEQLHALGNFLWEDNFINNIKLLNTSPIENIVSCKAIPINIDGENSTIGLGNIDSGVSGMKISSNYLKKTIGSIDVPSIYNNFVDYEYSSIDLYLPLIGTITDLNPREVVGYSITLKYCFDVVSGDCLAMLFNNRGGGTNCIGVYKGNCGIDIPLTASNRAQIQAGYVSDVIGGTLSVASGHPFGAIMAGMNAITRQNVTKSSGSISGVTAQGLPKKAYLTIVENATQIPSNYAETYGRPCNLTKKLKNLSGFTIVDKNIRLSNINCTYEEKEEIRKLLSEGVIL